MRRVIPYILLLFITLSLNVKAQNVQAFADTDSTEYIVGDYIYYILEVKYPKGVKVTIPSVKDSINNLEFIKEEPSVKQESGSEIYELHKYIFSKYDSSDVTIPSYNIAYSTDGTNVQYVRVNPVNIIVKTIEVDPQADIQDVKKPIRIPLDWMAILIIALIVLAIVLLAFFGYKYYKKKHTPIKPQKVKITVLPYQKALGQLHQLEEKKLWQQGKVKEYHSEITGIIRDYFEERFHFDALEMTTPEIIDNLKSRHVTTDVVVKTEEFLQNADMVKFAKFQPMPTVNEEMMKEAYFIVDNTKNKAAESELAKLKEAEEDAE